MSLTIVVTRNVQRRYRGYLGSVMLELAPGLYISPRMNKNVRERVWSVMKEWHDQLGEGSITMLWRDRKAAGHVRILQLGEAPKSLVENDGLLLACREITCREIKGGTPIKDASH